MKVQQAGQGPGQTQQRQGRHLQRQHLHSTPLSSGAKHMSNDAKHVCIQMHSTDMLQTLDTSMSSPSGCGCVRPEGNATNRGLQAAVLRANWIVPHPCAWCLIICICWNGSCCDRQVVKQKNTVSRQVCHAGSCCSRAGASCEAAEL